MDWFLYNNGLRHERVNPLTLSNICNQTFFDKKITAKSRELDHMWRIKRFDSICTI